MYVHSSFPNKVYALDLSKPGAPQIWQYTPEQPADAIPIACCDLVNRGLAYSPKYGKFYIELLQGDLLALECEGLGEAGVPASRARTTRRARR